MKDDRIANLRHRATVVQLVLAIVIVFVFAATLAYRFVGDWAVLAILVLALWALVIEHVVIRVRQVEIASPKVKQTYRILQISDFHDNRLGLKQIIRRVQKLKPDLVVYSGDTMEGYGDNYQPTEALFAALQDFRQLAILGNHENDFREIERLFDQIAQKYGVKLLNDRCELVAEIAIYGADWGNLEAEFAPATDRYNILLTHAPWQAKFLIGRNSGFDVAVCGHEHGGQIRLPLVKGLISAKGVLFPDLKGILTKGVKQVGRTTVSVSSGAGWSLFPLRFGCPSEIVLYTVKPTK